MDKLTIEEVAEKAYKRYKGFGGDPITYGQFRNAIDDILRENERLLNIIETLRPISGIDWYGKWLIQKVLELAYQGHSVQIFTTTGAYIETTRGAGGGGGEGYSLTGGTSVAGGGG